MADTFHEVWSFMHVKAWTILFLTVLFLFYAWAGYFQKLPAYLKTLSFRRFYIYAALLAGLFFFSVFFLDEALGIFAKNASGTLFKAVWKYGAEMGRSIWIFLFFAYVLTAGNSKAREYVFGAVLTTSMTGLTATIFKHLVLRARPDALEGANSFFNWDHLGADSRSYQSFPSGDVSIVAGACFFFMLAVKNPILKILLILTPIATGIARMRLERHWFSDAWAAAAIALGWAFLIWNYERFRNLNKPA